MRGCLALDVAHRSAHCFPDNKGIQREEVNAMGVALTLEYIHASSLIVDDMPYFDNDNYRRGKESTHFLYGTATAHMVVGALVALSLECIARQGDYYLRTAQCPEDFLLAGTISTRLLFLISTTLGIKGLTGGQLTEFSLSKSAEELTQSTIEDIIHRKTAVLFEAAVLSGWIIGTGKSSSPLSEETKLVQEAAKHYGMAFQIADDIGDVDKDVKAGNGKTNFAVVYGKEKAWNRLSEELRLCREKLYQLGLWSPVWSDAFRAVDGMTK